MSQWIEIDDQVLAILQMEAEALVDSPNRVLRRLLGLPPGGREPQSVASSSRPSRARAPWGALLQHSSFELPILRALAEHGGAAPRHRVLEAVEKQLGDSLTEFDRGRVPSGMVRWEVRASEVRRALRERGWMKADSPRGLWELTDAGIEELGRLEAEAQKREREASQ